MNDAVCKSRARPAPALSQACALTVVEPEVEARELGHLRIHVFQPHAHLGMRRAPVDYDRVAAQQQAARPCRSRCVSPSRNVHLHVLSVPEVVELEVYSAPKNLVGPFALSSLLAHEALSDLALHKRLHTALARHRIVHEATV